MQAGQRVPSPFVRMSQSFGAFINICFGLIFVLAKCVLILYGGRRRDLRHVELPP